MMGSGIAVLTHVEAIGAACQWSMQYGASIENHISHISYLRAELQMELQALSL